jgi:hypothetical protein
VTTASWPGAWRAHGSQVRVLELHVAPILLAPNQWAVGSGTCGFYERDATTRVLRHLLHIGG